MVCTLSYQMYKYEYGLTAAEQRAADVRAGEAAAALTDLRLHFGHVFGRGRHGRPTRRATDAVTAPVRVMPSAR